MRIEQTPLKDCFIIHEKVHGDARGYFIETYNSRDIKDATGLDLLGGMSNIKGNGNGKTDAVKKVVNQLEKAVDITQGTSDGLSNGQRVNDVVELTVEVVKSASSSTAFGMKQYTESTIVKDTTVPASKAKDVVNKINERNKTIREKALIQD